METIYEDAEVIVRHNGVKEFFIKMKTNGHEIRVTSCLDFLRVMCYSPDTSWTAVTVNGVVGVRTVGIKDR